MIKDPIVEEVREARRAVFKAHGNSLGTYLKDLRERQVKAEKDYVSLKPKRVKKSA